MLLFATKTCPNCKVADALLTKAGIPFEKIIADENPDKATAYGVKQAPTLIIEQDGDAEKIVNLSNIKKFIEQQKQA